MLLQFQESEYYPQLSPTPKAHISSGWLNYFFLCRAGAGSGMGQASNGVSVLYDTRVEVLGIPNFAEALLCSGSLLSITIVILTINIASSFSI